MILPKTLKHCFTEMRTNQPHPTTGDVADLLLLGMRRYVLSSAGNNSVIGRKHRLKPGIVSNESSWPSLRACNISFCIKLLAP